MFKNLFCKKEEKVTKIFVKLESLDDLYKVIEPPKITFDKDTIEGAKKMGIDITDPTRYFDIITIGAKYGLNSKGVFKLGDIVKISGEYKLNSNLIKNLDDLMSDLRYYMDNRFLDQRTVMKDPITGEYGFANTKTSKRDLAKYKYKDGIEYCFIIKSK